MASTQTNLRERMEVAEGPEPAPADQDTCEAPTLRVTQRMAAMRKECSGIGKQDITMTPREGKSFTIKGHTVEAVLAEIRPMLDRHGLGLTPDLIERTYSGNRCDIIVAWEFEGLELGDTKVIRWAGAGTDNGDKAFAKAGTNSLKEMLKKVFLVTDKADAAEETESVEHKTDENIRREDMEIAKAERQAAIQKWAGAFKSALENAQSEKAVDALSREHNEQLNSPDLPAVTRQFFFDLIQTRKKTLREIAAERAADDDFPGDRR